MDVANATRCAKFAKREAHVRYTLRNQHPSLSRGALRSPIEKRSSPRRGFPLSSTIGARWKLPLGDHRGSPRHAEEAVAAQR